MNKNDIEKFNKKYQDVPKERIDRFIFLMKKLKVKDKEIRQLKERALKLLRASWSSFSFTINFTPQSTPRPRAGRFGFYVKGASDNFKLFQTFMEELRATQQVDVITTPTKIYIDSYFPIPEGMNRFEKVLSELKLIRPISKPDWDNIGKTYSDMIQKNLLLEDCTIVEGVSRKYYSARPRVEVTLKYMDQYDCKYHKRKIEDWKTYKELEIEEKETLI